MKDFIDGAEDGLIVFSLGSFLSVTSIPRAIQKGISAAFKKLPSYRFANSIVMGALYCTYDICSAVEEGRRSPNSGCSKVISGSKYQSTCICPPAQLAFQGGGEAPIRRLLRSGYARKCHVSRRHSPICTPRIAQDKVLLSAIRISKENISDCACSLRLFVTHFGGVGTMEAIWAAVPMVGMALEGDQGHGA